MSCCGAVERRDARYPNIKVGVRIPPRTKYLLSSENHLLLLITAYKLQIHTKEQIEQFYIKVGFLAEFHIADFLSFTLLTLPQTVKPEEKRRISIYSAVEKRARKLRPRVQGSNPLGNETFALGGKPLLIPIYNINTIFQC